MDVSSSSTAATATIWEHAQEYLSEHPVVEQWLYRILATVAVAFLLQYWYGSPLTATSSSNSNTINKNGRVLSRLTTEVDDHPSPSAPPEEMDEDTPLTDDDAINKTTAATDSDAPSAAAHPETTSLTTTTTTSQPSRVQPRVRSSGRRSASTRITSQQPAQPPIKSKSNAHPGLDSFLRWHHVQASLYRIYTVGHDSADTDAVTEVAPPFIPKSERGHVSLILRVTNHYRRAICAYWIDYKGREIRKGTFTNGRDFEVSTWIGHPWVFREEESQRLLLHYIPYRVIPTTNSMPTVDANNPTQGIHRFTICSQSQIQRNDSSFYTSTDQNDVCWIRDPIFPTNISTVHEAAAWSFQEMERTNYHYGIETLQKYITNIVLHPSEPKYRQIRIAHAKFGPQIWQTPARGLLLAAGFLEQGAYAELGCANQSLSNDLIQELSTLLVYLERFKTQQEQQHKQDTNMQQQQPDGADGFGRANYGRVGMNQ